jgi:hypothetical protein
MYMIVCENPDKTVELVYPAQEFLAKEGELRIALKDIPEGIPFWLVSSGEVPEDYLFSGAWEIPEEWGPPDGYGSKYHTFEELDYAEDQS